MLSRLCKDNHGEYVCIIPACSSPRPYTDSILDLEAKKGRETLGVEEKSCYVSAALMLPKRAILPSAMES